MRRTFLLPALLATAALASVPAPAQARVAWQDCQANRGSSLQGQYTIAELNKSLKTMPTFVQEYSDCVSVIEAQIKKQELAEHGGGSGGTPTTGAGGSGNQRGSDPKAHVAADNPGGNSGILIGVIVVIAVLGMVLAFWASRRRRGGSPPADGPPPASS